MRCACRRSRSASWSGRRSGTSAAGRGGRDGGARGSARAAAADRDLRALVLGPSSADRGAGDERRAGGQQQRYRRFETASRRPRGARRSAAARPAEAAAARRANPRAEARRSAPRPRPPAPQGRACRSASAVQTRASDGAVDAEQGRRREGGDEQQRREAQPVRGDLATATLSSATP